MAPRIFFWLVGTMLAGFIFLYLGYRGRRINKSPCCKQCGFDLAGVLPAGVTCPECGAGVKLARFVRLGQRKRMYSLIALGWPAIILPMLPLATVFFSTMTRTDLGKYKPLNLLVWESGSAAEDDLRKIAGELFTRQTSGNLADADYTRIVNAALAIQADRTRPWLEEWAQLVTQARLDKKMSADEYRDFLTQGAVLDWNTRPSCPAGSPARLEAMLRTTRILADSQAVMWVFLERVRINGRVVLERPAPAKNTSESFFGFLSGEALTQQVYLYPDFQKGNAQPWVSFGRGMDGAGFSVPLPEDLAPGTYDIEFDIALSAADAQWQTGKLPPPRWKRLTEVRSIEVTAKGTPVVQILAASEPDNEAFQTLAPKDASSHAYGGSAFAMVSLPKDPGLKTPFAFKVILRKGDRFATIGRIHSGKTSPKFSEQSPVSIGARGVFNLNGAIPPSFVGEEVDVILEPDPVLAAMTIDLDRIYGGVIVFTKVKLTADDEGSPMPSILDMDPDFRMGVGGTPLPAIPTAPAETPEPE